MGESVANIDVLSVDDLKRLVVEVFEANAVLRAEIAMLRDEIARHASQRVAIPLARGAESLNVAIAAGIILYEIQRG